MTAEGRSLWGFDTKLDKFLDAEMIKGMDNLYYTTWFTSKEKCILIAYSDIANPDNAQTKWYMEFKSPNMFVMTTIINNKSVKAESRTKLKEYCTL